MDDLEIIGFQGDLGKIPQVECHDGIGPAMVGRRNHMAIIGIGAMLDQADQTVMAGNKAVAGSGIHQVPDTLQRLPVQIRPVHQKIAHPFFMDLLRPSGTKQIKLRHLHHQITERCRIKHAGIQDDGEASSPQ